MNIRWNADLYSNNFSFVYKYGEDILKFLDVGQGDVVVDLGCGNGVLTSKLSKMGLCAIGIDASQQMLSVAKKSFPELDFRQADALSFVLDQPVDAIFSNAVFHGVNRADQPRLLRQIFQALKPNGELVCEFGGKGCASHVHNTLIECFRKRRLKYTLNFFFSSIGEYATLLEQAGLRCEYAVLFDRPTRQENGEHGLAEWIRMFDTVPFIGLSDILCDEFIAEAEQKLRPVLWREGAWFVDYVRIRVKARKRK